LILLGKTLQTKSRIVTGHQKTYHRLFFYHFINNIITDGFSDEKNAQTKRIYLYIFASTSIGEYGKSPTK
jgi:hypothetical protein